MKAFGSLVITILLFLLSFNGYSQIASSYVFSLDSLPAKGIELNKGWKFHAGDDTAWTNPYFDDSQWANADLDDPSSYLTAFNRKHIGWFRLKLRMDSALRINPVALQISQLGALELYVNKSLLIALGSISANTLAQTNNAHGKPYLFQGSLSTDTITLTIRFASPAPYRLWMLTSMDTRPLSIKVSPWLNAINEFKATLIAPRAPIGLSFMAIWLGILFILLYTFFPKEKINLLFGAFCFFMGLLTVLYFQLAEGNLNMNTYSWTGFAIEMTNKILGSLILSIFAVEVLGKITLFQSILIGYIVIGDSLVSLFAGNSRIQTYLTLAARLLLMFEFLRLATTALKLKNYIIGVLAVSAFLLNFVIMLFGFGWVSTDLSSRYGTINSYFFFFAITIYIASKYARKSNGWLLQLEETRKLGAQNLEKEREKQLILASQNEMLEQRVKERTSELTKSLKDLKETQSQLVQSEKMASLGELTAGIAHEIQNPLNFVNNFSDVNTELIDEMNEALDKGDLNEARSLSFDIRDNQEKISHHGHRADSIVKSMLQHSRASTGQKEPTDINGLADEYFRLSYHGLRAKDKMFNANLITHLDASVGEVLIVPQDMGRVFLNLFNNAFYSVFQKKIRLAEQKATAEETAAYDPTVWLTTSRKENSIEISIRDNGLGIPAKILDKIFQPFFTSKPVGQGTGLGLSLSYDIVTQEHGGDLKASSAEGEYAEFIVVLPIGG